MNKLNSTSKLIIAAVVAVGAIALIIQYGGGGMAGQKQNNTMGSGGNGNTPPPAATQGTTAASSKPAPVVPKTTGGSTVSPISLTGPLAGASWTIGTINTVSWSKPAGISGQIDLLDAATGKLVGVILVQAGPNQTSYDWNTRDLYLSRTSPLKTTVTPGRYNVRISWDNASTRPITSPVVAISQ